MNARRTAPGHRRLVSALALLSERRPDVAVRDVNLAGEQVYRVAEELERTSVPVIFVTGYGRFGIGPRWAGKPIFQKPYGADTRTEAFARVLGC